MPRLPAANAEAYCSYGPSWTAGVGSCIRRVASATSTGTSRVVSAAVSGGAVLSRIPFILACGPSRPEGTPGPRVVGGRSQVSGADHLDAGVDELGGDAGVRAGVGDDDVDL